MSNDVRLLFTDIGMIGTISALIVLAGILLGRREEREKSAGPARAAATLEELIRRAS